MNGHKDIFGKEIKVGDYICYGAVDGRSGVIRVGRVVELSFRDTYYEKGTPIVKVHAAEYGWKKCPEPQSKAVTLSFTSRMAVLSEEQVSEDWKEAIAKVGKK